MREEKTPVKPTIDGLSGVSRVRLYAAMSSAKNLRDACDNAESGTKFRNNDGNNDKEGENNRGYCVDGSSSFQWE